MIKFNKKIFILRQMSGATYIENTQTMRGFTSTSAAVSDRLAIGTPEPLPLNSIAWTDDGDTDGAPWEIHIKSIETRATPSPDTDPPMTSWDPPMTSWGTTPYSEPGGSANMFAPNEGEGSINEHQAEILGNHIHRLLKYYLGEDKHSNIESVRLNIVLKFHAS